MPADDPLAVLGLTGPQRRAYELLLDHPGAAADQLGPQWTEREPLAGVLAELEDHGLASSVPGPPQRFRAVAPTVAFDARLAEVEDRLEHARRHVGTLDAAYPARSANRDASSLDALVKLFDGLWARALPLHPPGDGQRSGPLAQRLITLLLSGLTDEAIAHQLGLSHRTVQRRVAALMAELGAHTRFQAGVQAALHRGTQVPT